MRGKQLNGGVHTPDSHDLQYVMKGRVRSTAGSQNRNHKRIVCEGGKQRRIHLSFITILSRFFTFIEHVYDCDYNSMVSLNEQRPCQNDKLYAPTACKHTCA